jgi:hypothetical protein
LKVFLADNIKCFGEKRRFIYSYAGKCVFAFYGDCAAGYLYKAAYFANSERVDRISLACSFIGNEDERIEMSIDELLEDL